MFVDKSSYKTFLKGWGFIMKIVLYYNTKSSFFSIKISKMIIE